MGDMMLNYYKVAEEERNQLVNPYVGSEHFFLAILKYNKISSISYNDFKKIIIKIVGSCYKNNNYVIYTPILRNYKNSNLPIKDVILELLENEDTILHNMLISEQIDIEKIEEEIKNTTIR